MTKVIRKRQRVETLQRELNLEYDDINTRSKQFFGTFVSSKRRHTTWTNVTGIGDTSRHTSASGSASGSGGVFQHTGTVQAQASSDTNRASIVASAARLSGIVPDIATNVSPQHRARMRMTRRTDTIHQSPAPHPSPR